MDYYSYWGLKEPPFSMTPDPKRLYMSKQHSECLLRLKYAVTSNKGGSLLISENAGDGKTSVLKLLMAQLEAENPGRYRTAFISHPTLTPRQMISQIALQTGCQILCRDKMKTLNEFRGYLETIAAAGQSAVVVVDEGQMLARRPDVLDELRILLNFCVEDRFLLSFILSGQRPLEKAVRVMPEFWQRLPVRFFLGNLDFQDSRAMIRHRLKLAGLPEGERIFTDAAEQLIFEFTKGCPRVICSVADLALMVGQARRVRDVDDAEVQQAIADMETPTAGASYHYFHAIKNRGSLKRPAAEKRRCPVCDKEREVSEKMCPHCGHDLKDARRLENILSEIHRLRPEKKGAPARDARQPIVCLPRKRWPWSPALSVEIRGAKRDPVHFTSGLTLTQRGVRFDGGPFDHLTMEKIESVETRPPGMVLKTIDGLTFDVEFKRMDRRMLKVLSLAGEFLKLRTNPAALPPPPHEAFAATEPLRAEESPSVQP